MPASYQTGISSSPTNLLQTIVTWLISQGWTEEISGSEGTGWRAHLYKGGVYVNLRAAMNEKIWSKLPTGNWDRVVGYGIGLILGSGFSAGYAWDIQPGVPLRTDGSPSGCGMNLPSGSVAAYHLFDDGQDNIIVVVERNPGVFVHMGWGLALAGGGAPEAFPYFYASSSAYRTADQTPDYALAGIQQTAWTPFAYLQNEEPGDYDWDCAAFVRVDAATWVNRWVGNGNDTDVNNGYTGRRLSSPINLNGYDTSRDRQYPNYNYMVGRTHQTAFAGALLLPMHVCVHTDPAGRWAPIGYAPNVFFCEAVGNGYAAGEVVAIGGLNYMLFPYFAVRKAA